MYKGLGSVNFLQANEHLVYHAFDSHKHFPKSAPQLTVLVR